MQNHWIVTPYALDQPEPALEALAQAGWAVNRGEAGHAPGGQMARMAAIHQPLIAGVARAAAEGRRAVSVAGDCCATIAVVAGLQRAGIDPLIVWLDAHGDFNTHETTITGFIGGMPLAMITGRGDQTLTRAAGLRIVPDTDVILADARDLDPTERTLLEQSAVTQTSAFEAIADLTGDRQIYVHFDVDVIGAAHAPAMSYPVRGGPSPDRLQAVAAALNRTGRLAAASMTPWALAQDADGRTAAACWRVFNALVAEA